MTIEIKMPQLGESVVEGTISRWLKQPGDQVGEYEPLLEVMTDKVDTEVPAPQAGVLREIVVPAGETVRVGTLLARLEREEPAASSQQSAVSSQQPIASNQQSAANSQQPTASTQNFVSPVVARLAAEHNLDLRQLAGSGQGGRVTKQDVMRYLEGRTNDERPTTDDVRATPPAVVTPEPALQEVATSVPQPREMVAERPVAPAPSPALPIDIPEDAELVPISPMRRAIAEHMVRSRSVAPHVTTVVEVDLSRIVAHRERRKAEFERQGVKLTFTPYFVQATVAALQAVPVLNSSYTDQGILLHGRINVGVAVALDEGLIVPVIHDADEKNLLGLSRAVNDLSARARSRRLKPDETRDGTFSITNHGVSGSLFATPIINQPQVGILGVGAIQKRAVVLTQDGVDAIAIRPMCYISLTFDHRVTDGATADQFLMTVKQTLERYSLD